MALSGDVYFKKWNFVGPQKAYFICDLGTGEFPLICTVATEAKHMYCTETSDITLGVSTYRSSCIYETTMLETILNNIIMKYSKF